MLRLPRLSISNGGLDAVLDAEHPAEHAGRVARRRLDLDDVGAPVGQHSAGGGARHPDAEFDDHDALHRSGHRHPFQTLYKYSSNL